MLQFGNIFAIISYKEFIMEPKFKKFEPMTADAKNRIQELIKRGGHIISEHRSHVLIQRMESVAKIDQYGRVEWNAENFK